MEHNENENQNLDGDDFSKKDGLPLKERKGGNSGIWYLVIVILILGLLGWYGYTTGWFNKDVQDVPKINTENKQDETPFSNSNDVKASINNVTIQTSEGFPVKKTLVVKGNLDNDCFYINDPQTIRDGSTFYVNLTTRKEGNSCSDTSVPYERNIDLEVLGLPAGVYSVVINGKEISFELEQDNVVDFSSGVEK